MLRRVKKVRFERGVSELSQDVCEINPHYDNIIIVDDLMAESTVLWYLDCLPIVAIEMPVLSCCCNTCFLKVNMIRISVEMPSTWLSSEVLAGNTLELLENACLTNRVHFINAYYKETEKPFGYLLVDNKPHTPADQQILADLFGECYAYHFCVNNTDGVEPTCVETMPAGKPSTTKIIGL